MKKDIFTLIGALLVSGMCMAQDDQQQQQQDDQQQQQQQQDDQQDDSGSSSKVEVRVGGEIGANGQGGLRTGGEDKPVSATGKVNVKAAPYLAVGNKTVDVKIVKVTADVAAQASDKDPSNDNRGATETKAGLHIGSEVQVRTNIVEVNAEGSVGHEWHGATPNAVVYKFLGGLCTPDPKHERIQLCANYLHETHDMQDGSKIFANGAELLAQKRLGDSTRIFGGPRFMHEKGEGGMTAPSTNAIMLNIGVIGDLNAGAISQSRNK